MSEPTGVTIAEEPLGSPDARALIGELDRALEALYPPENNFLDLPAEDVGDGRGVFVIARVDGLAVGCGAVRVLDDDPATVEVKRMYVRPAARGRGVGRLVLDALEQWARARGARRAVLEAGERQPEALRLYERAGFHRIPCFGAYAASSDSVCYEKLF